MIKRIQEGSRAWVCKTIRCKADHVGWLVGCEANPKIEGTSLSGPWSCRVDGVFWTFFFLNLCRATTWGTTGLPVEAILKLGIPVQVYDNWLVVVNMLNFPRRWLVD